MPARPSNDSERGTRATVAINALDAMPAQVAALDPSGRIVLVNAAWRRFAAEHAGEARAVGEGDNYLEACATERDPERAAVARTLAEAIRDVVAGRASGSVHEYRCDAGGVPRWFEARVTALPGSAPAPVVLSFTDISGQRQAEAERASVQRRFESMFQQAPDPLLLATTDGIILQANREAERVFGYGPGELVGRPVEVLVPPDQRDAHEQQRRAFEPTPTPRHMGGDGRRIRAVRKDGSSLIVEVVLASLETGDGLATVASIRDVSARCALEDQLLRAQRHEVIGQLSSAIAHDFNNLIQVIGTSAECALNQLPPDAPARRDVDLIRIAGGRASSLIRRMLSFGSRTPQPEALDLQALITGFEPLLQRLMGPLVRISVRFQGARHPVCADRTQIEQLLLNLTANARDAMPSGGTLTLELATRPGPDSGGAPGGEVVELVVRDTGTGMDAATRARIFEPFFTTKGEDKGTGLGLATVLGIVKQSGGEIWCDSQPGQGTTFTMQFPAADPTASAGACSGDQQDEPVGRGTETILVIDDEEFLRHTVSRMLEQRGYHVLAAGSGEEAVEMVERYEGPLDLVVTDILMPGMSGWEAVERIRERRQVRALFTSGYPDEMTDDRGASPGARFIAKPFSGVSLARKVREVLAAS